MNVIQRVQTNLNNLKELAKDEDPTVNIVNKERSRELGVAASVQMKMPQNSKTPKRNLRKEKKDQTRKTNVGGVVTTRPTGTVQQWDNSVVSAKT